MNRATHRGVMRFLKNTYSISETAELLNEYFSVTTFKTKDIVNMFFEGVIEFSIQCNFTNLTGISVTGEKEKINCDITLHGADNIDSNCIFNDGYAEVSYLKEDGDPDYVVGGGLFNVDSHYSRVSMDGNSGYIHFELIEFIEYANMEIYPKNLEHNCIYLSFIRDERDEITINIDSVLILQRNILDCILLLEQRNKSAFAFLSIQSGTHPSQLHSNTLESKEKTSSQQDEKINERLLKTVKVLLAVHYGEDIAEKVRSNIAEYDSTQGVKYSNGAIQIAFDKKGYKLPFTGKYLNQLLKDIDISDLKT